jgi:hypothetical protein
MIKSERKDSIRSEYYESIYSAYNLTHNKNSVNSCGSQQKPGIELISKYIRIQENGGIQLVLANFSGF